MKTLGVILAGGRSIRFGSDKAQALFNGLPLLDHAMAALQPHCDMLVIAGAPSPLAPSIEDWPEAAMGPLGGIAAALHHAHAQGIDQVLSVPVDCVSLPHNLRARLEPAPSFMASQPVIGLWPQSAAGAVARILLGRGSNSVRALASAIGARAVHGSSRFANINSPADLTRLEKLHGI